jgi:hypothetical protein
MADFYVEKVPEFDVQNGAPFPVDEGTQVFDRPETVTVFVRPSDNPVFERTR